MHFQIASSQSCLEYTSGNSQLSQILDYIYFDEGVFYLESNPESHSIWHLQNNGLKSLIYQENYGALKGQFFQTENGWDLGISHMYETDQIINKVKVIQLRENNFISESTFTFQPSEISELVTFSPTEIARYDDGFIFGFANYLFANVINGESEVNQISLNRGRKISTSNNDIYTLKDKELILELGAKPSLVFDSSILDFETDDNFGYVLFDEYIVITDLTTNTIVDSVSYVIPSGEVTDFAVAQNEYLFACNDLIDYILKIDKEDNSVSETIYIETSGDHEIQILKAFEDLLIFKGNVLVDYLHLQDNANDGVQSRPDLQMSLVDCGPTQDGCFVVLNAVIRNIGKIDVHRMTIFSDRFFLGFRSEEHQFFINETILPGDSILVSDTFCINSFPAIKDLNFHLTAADNLPLENISSNSFNCLLDRTLAYNNFEVELRTNRLYSYLSWNYSKSGVAYFKVYHSQNLKTWVEVQSINQEHEIQNYTYPLNQFTDGNYFKIEAIHYSGLRSSSNIIWYFQDKVRLTVYPNPTTDGLKLYCTQPTNLYLFNFDGKMVLNTTRDQYTNYLALDHLPKGCYILRMENPTESFTDKIILR